MSDHYYNKYLKYKSKYLSLKGGVMVGGVNEGEVAVTCGMWNILSDGLSKGEFMTKFGDDATIKWNNRKDKIVNILSEMFTKCDMVVTVENDHFFWLLNQLNMKHGNKIKGVFAIESDMTNKYSNSKKFLDTRTKTESTFKIEECPDEFIGLYNFYFKKDDKGVINKGPTKIFTKDSIYTSDDGIGIYYNSDKVQLIGVDSDKPMSGDQYTLYNTTKQYTRCVFTKDGVEFQVYGGHLKSGEAYKDEVNRICKLGEMFGKAKKDVNPIILMDSNSSDLYQKDYPDKVPTVNDVMKDNKFKDTVETKYNECFKMRHAQGEQPKKFCQLMFDTIDKIVVKEGVSTTDSGLDFSNYKFPKTDYDTILKLRTDKGTRDALANYCKEHKWGDSMDSNKKDDKNDALSGVDLNVLNELYPSEKLPSDHPPIAKTIMLKQTQRKTLELGSIDAIVKYICPDYPNLSKAYTQLQVLCPHAPYADVIKAEPRNVKQWAYWKYGEWGSLPIAEKKAVIDTIGEYNRRSNLSRDDRIIFPWKYSNVDNQINFFPYRPNTAEQGYRLQDDYIEQNKSTIKSNLENLTLDEIREQQLRQQKGLPREQPQPQPQPRPQPQPQDECIIL